MKDKRFLSAWGLQMILQDSSKLGGLDVLMPWALCLLFQQTGKQALLRHGPRSHSVPTRTPCEGLETHRG